MTAADVSTRAARATPGSRRRATALDGTTPVRGFAMIPLATRRQELRCFFLLNHWAQALLRSGEETFTVEEPLLNLRREAPVLFGHLVRGVHLAVDERLP